MDRLVAPLVGLCLVVALFAMPVAGDHGSASNYTVVPYDRQPGLTDASYEQHATAPYDFDYLDYIGATWKEGGFTNCGPTNSDTFGIDRNGDAPGTKTDEGLQQYVEDTDIGEDKFVANFYEKDDAIGTSTNLDAGDEFVAVTNNCFDNPDEPGWYQIQSSIGGTAPNGSYVEATDVSHYFYVCDCSSEREAREKLGPPPSEPTPTATPTATPEPTPTRTPPSEGTPFPSPTPTPTPAEITSTSAAGPSADAGEATPAASTGDAATATAVEAADPVEPGTSTPTPKDWDSYARETPTVGAGPGFGIGAALAGLAGAALVAARRR